MENNLPKGWVLVPLKEIAKVEWGNTSITKKSYVGKGYPAFSASGRDGYLNSYEWEGEGIILSAIGARCGKCFFANERWTAIKNTIVIQSDPKYINHKLLYYYLNDETKWMISGSGQPFITMGSANKLLIPLPPKEEQDRLVAKLDELMEKIDRSRARLERIPKILKRFRQSILSAALSGKLTEEWRDKNTHHNGVAISSEYKISEDYRELTELPSNWKWVAIGNYVKCNRGRFSVRPRNDPRYFGGGIPFIQIGDLPREGGFVNKHTQTLNQDGLKVSKMFPKNTVAIAIVGATIGNTGILNYDMCFTDSMVGINTGELQLNLFIDYYLRNEKENLRQLSYAGGGQPNIKLELLNAYPFPLPPLEEQREIVRRIDKLFTVTDKIEARYHIAKAQVDKLPQSLLAKAFRGELVGQGENDEPAIVLLERSKAAKSMDPRLTRSTKEF